jgi:alanine racemase
MVHGFFDITFSSLEKITDGQILQFSRERKISHLFIDSRKPVLDQEALFFAITGEHHNGHTYIDQLYASGVRQFVIEQDIPISHLSEANILRVRKTVHALQQIAIAHREKFSGPIIGVAGSNAKTIVKEWIYQLLSSRFVIAKNPGSYNSQLGVPLSVWQLQPEHELGIFEAGISKPGEMRKLKGIIKPTLGIFTNIGSAHDEGFNSLKEKIEEKLELFTESDLIIYCADHKPIHEQIQRKKIPSLNWGYNADSNIRLEQHDNEHVAATWNGIRFNFILPFSDHASVENCFHCITLMLHFGYSDKEINERLRELKSVPMRLELKEGINQCQIVDDSYNNDFGGLQIGLEFLANQHQKKKRTLIISDILESGLPDNILVKKIADLVSRQQLERIIGIGPVLSSYSSLFGPSGVFFRSTDDFLHNFDFDSFQNEIILVKGARLFAFEKIIHRLQKKVHGTVMEIDLGSIVHNLNYFRSRLKPSTKLMVMVKAFAYGSGSTEVANLLQYHKVDYLGVAYADEGVELRKNNITLPIMVMNPSEESFGQLLAYRLEPEVYSFKILNSLLHYLEGQPCTIHIKLDTGMHRLGFDRNDLPELKKTLGENPNLTIASIFTHLAGADEREHDEFSNQQAVEFAKGADSISNLLGYKPLYHALNSPGILRLPALQFDMVRLGIGLYGVDPTPYHFNDLHPVAELKTLISQIKHISAGETIGYGRRGKAERDLLIATIAIGYADGFSRAFSRGVGEVLIHGRRAKVIGNVCMDMTMVDITDIDAQEGDEVIVFGKGLPIQEVAAKINTIPYEILTNTSERVKRIFVAESI